MCYDAVMERIAIRELRNHASRVVRRARAGERIVITVDGVPAAQLVPLDPEVEEPTIEGLIRQGRLIAPRTSERASPPAPIRVTHARALSDVVSDLRDR